MSTILLICLALTFKSVISFSSSGKHFVASCPWIRDKGTCTAQISTHMSLIKVSIRQYKQQGFTTKKFFVGRTTPIDYMMEGMNEDPNNRMHDRSAPMAKYPVRVFMSNKIFRVIVLTRLVQNMFEKCGAIILTPKSSCYKSYYIVTAQANPFIAIFSFDYSNSEVKITFPSSKVNYDMKCFASTNCAPEKTVSFKMSKYEAWYFTIKDYMASLLNALITSSKPVSVISGNRYGWTGSNTDSWDIATTSLKSPKTWGKTYIIPHIVTTTIYFAFMAAKFPLDITFHEGGTTSEKKFTAMPTELEEYGTSSNTLAVTSDQKFSLYQVFASRPWGEKELGDVGILNIIPIEYWIPSFTYVDTDLSAIFKVKCYLITETLQDDVNFPSSVKDSKSFKWHSSTTSIKGKTYSIAEFNPGTLDSKITVRAEHGRVMVYVTMLPTGFTAICFASYPYDFLKEDMETESGWSNLWIILLAILLFLVILAIIAYLMWRRKQKKKGQQEQEQQQQQDVENEDGKDEDSNAQKDGSDSAASSISSTEQQKIARQRAVSTYL